MTGTGSSAYIEWDYETTFNNGGTVSKAFGCNQKVTGLRWLNNLIALPELYTPEIKAFAYGKNEGAASIEWVLSNPWFFDFIFNTPEKTGAGPYTYTWSSDPDWVGSGAYDNTGVRNVKSGHFEIGFDGSTANVVRNAKGVILPSLSLRTSINETVKVTSQWMWGKEDTISTTLDTTVPEDDIGFPYTFVHATLELPNGSVIATIQDLELTFNPDTELIYGIGSPTSIASSGKKIITMTGKFKKAMVDSAMLQKVINRTEEATLEIVFTNGLASTSERSITFLGTGVGISEHDNDMVPGEIVFENLQWQIRSMKVTAVNNTSAVP